MTEIDAAKPPHGNEWDLRTLIEDRLHISRTATDHPVIFLEGRSETFGNYGTFPGARHLHAKDLDSGRDFEGLLLPAPRESLGGAKALAHIIYEMANVLRAGNRATNEDVLNSIRWVLGLLGPVSDTLSTEAQLGLAGECVLLRELLELGRTAGVSPSAVLDRWVDATRDFAAQGISIEVKTTAGNSRIHHIGSIIQLEPTAVGETVYLYSLGIKTELLHDRKLTAYIDDVAQWLVTASGEADTQALGIFYDMLTARGYDPSHHSLYQVGPGLMLNVALPARLYRVADLDYLRVESFKDNSLPSMVRTIGYELELPDNEASTIDERAVLLDLLRADPL